ncbi:MAG: serine hydrolase [Patescibacteria group bacterium]|jgi:beta-lactamase class A
MFLENFKEKIVKIISVRRNLAIIALALFFIGLGAGWTLRQVLRKGAVEISKFEMRESGYKFINPLLECEYGEELFSANFKKPVRDIEEAIKHTVEVNKVKEASVYYRDLNNGPWFGYNIEAKFSPASLLKVPIMIAYYKKAEDNPEALKKKIKYKKLENGVPQDIKPEVELKEGEEYTADELIENMIVYSDNNCADLLLKNIDKNFLIKVYKDLGVAVPRDAEPENFMTVREYAYFFRTLYNSSYLEREMSEKALEVLSRTKFGNGIRSGLPAGVLVAHKFGERKIITGEEEAAQLHDCGIIYFPKHNYLLCVMTRGQDFKTLEGLIGKISDIVYDEVTK